MSERVMDSNALEKERGITILSKVTSVKWKDHQINIVDTPGHADFGGEVERIMSMVDGVVLVVDATEGPMAQTKFVLSKALRHQLRPVVVLNKSDRASSRHSEVQNEILDLFIALECNEDQLDFPTLFASAREGWATHNLTDERKNMHPLLDSILERVPPPKADPTAPFSMLVTMVEREEYLGKMLTGRIYSGVCKVGDRIVAITADGKKDEGRVVKVLSRRGLERISVDSAGAGDIVSITGLPNASVNDTVCNIENTNIIQATRIDPPTISMNFGANDSPLAGREGKLLTGSMIGDRLKAEADVNVAIQIVQAPGKDMFEVRGRGELQLGILIENMRREGFELSVSPPTVVYKTSETGQRLEPIEEVMIDVDAEYMGAVIEKMSLRKGELQDSKDIMGKTRLRFLCPARGLIGYRSEFSTDTRGTGILNHSFHSYAPYKGEIDQVRKGVIISMMDGVCTGFALDALQSRGALFVSPQTKVYQGMIVGECARDGDMEVNPVKAKQLTNMRSVGSEEAIRLVKPREFSLEEAIAYVQPGEMVEVTPKNIRLRKAVLDGTVRKSLERQQRQMK
eukprot:TRINITY_DN14584_c0_g1_i1.p1 TRINITY_DN14584_c0_g1~~TRINITY_DN14584_c0_g1_i1.p1  ORF type:complete len:638 (-),score=160.51 TRINITY_DN14584_c0_g1_i1:11-1723(-)